MTNEQTQVDLWFRRFCARLHEILASGTVARLRPVAVDIQAVSFGQYSPVAYLDRGGRPMFEVWLDTYLNATASHHLSCWYRTDRRAIRALKDRLSHAWSITDIPEYDHRHRDDDDERLLTSHGKREETRISEPLIDIWDRDEAYAGLYVYPAPAVARSLEPVVDATIDALRRLTDVVRASREDLVVTVDHQDVDTERARRLARVLARPEQQRLRLQALEHHGACVITGEMTPAALEAAHIKPSYAGGADTMDNVLLLRADLHRLFDAGLLTIARGRQSCVWIARALLRPGSAYASLATLPYGGKTIHEAQWLALDTRNYAWNPDLGLTEKSAQTTRSPLLVPSRPV